MTILQINEELSSTNLDAVMKNYKIWKNLDGTSFDLDLLDKGEHLLNIKLLRNRYKNLIIQLEKRGSNRITAIYNNEIYLMAKTNGGYWRELLKDMNGIKKRFKKDKGL